MMSEGLGRIFLIRCCKTMLILSALLFACSSTHIVMGMEVRDEVFSFSFVSGDIFATLVDTCMLAWMGLSMEHMDENGRNKGMMQ